MPDDYDLDTDYPQDTKGNHMDTNRELQNATQPGAGDVDRKREPGLKDSWNVDTMFKTDSDGGGHMSQREMVAWGYEGKWKGKSDEDKKENSTGLLGNKTG